MSTNNPYEQLLIELTNRARLDPVGEAARFGIGLNDGVEPGKTISPAPKAPLAGSDTATQAARNHANWMRLNNAEGHFETNGQPGSTGVTPADRLAFARYGAFNN